VIDLKDVLKNKEDTIDELNRELDTVAQDKADYEQLCQDLNDKM